MVESAVTASSLQRNCRNGYFQCILCPACHVVPARLNTRKSSAPTGFDSFASASRR